MTRARILVVDDEPAIRSFLEMFLKHRGDAFAISQSGPDALELLERQSFDVLVSDLYMPGMNGLELIRKAKKRKPDLITIMLTGRATKTDVVEAIKEGVFDYIEKPLGDLATISWVLDRAIDRVRLIKERDRLMRALQQQNKNLETNLTTLNEAYERLIRRDEALKADLARAQRMQQSLLPSGFPPFQGMEFFGYYRSCERLGGDFFDFLPLNRNRAAIYLADVAGHGVRSAMVTVIVRQLIHTHQMLHPDSPVFEDPVQALIFLNQGLRAEITDAPIHVTMAYAVIDGATGKIVYGCAGHPPPILVGKQGSHPHMEARGPGLGVHAMPQFTPSHMHLDEGDTILLYSDGLTEATLSQEPSAPRRQIQQWLSPMSHLPAAEAGRRLEQRFNQHIGHQPLTDDVTFVLMRRTFEAFRTDVSEPSGSVRLVESTAEQPVLAKGARVAAGWATDACVFSIAGRATWQDAPLLDTLIAEARNKAESGQIFLELSECSSFDSTMLGLLLKWCESLTLHAVSGTVLQQIRELGLFDRLRITSDPIPKPTMVVQRPQDGSTKKKTELMLACHENLMHHSEQNRHHFAELVEMLRQDINRQTDPG